MKFNWGTGIAAFYGFFVLALVFQVIKSTQYDHSLVSDEYYADDLAYQQHYDKLVNSQQLKEDLSIVRNDSGTAIELKFPAGIEKVRGEIHFFCPSDSGQDFRLPLQLNAAGEQIVSTQGLKSGLWKVKVDWKGDGKAFYKEEVIII